MNKIIEFKNTNFAYNNTNSFNDFNMEIFEGDVITLIGPSGSGKSTLLKMICKKLPNDSIFFKGKSIKEYPLDIIRKNIVVIFDVEVEENTVYGELKRFLLKLNFNPSQIEEKIQRIDKIFNIEKLLNIDIANLTDEELALVKILRYLIIEPEFLAIDNMLSRLSKENIKKFFDYIKQQKITLLNVTNELEEALYGNKIYVLENFVLILEGSTMSVLKTDTLLKRLGFRLPFAVDLSIELGHYEVLKKIITDKEKLVNALWK